MECNCETRKAELITELYLTGRLDKKYFGRHSNSKKNPIKFYIESCLYKKRITPRAELVEDCYNEAFYHLQNIPAVKFLEIYTTSPNKLQAYALRIIALKCFADDPRYKNPSHSLVNSVLHASTHSGAGEVSTTDVIIDRTDSHVHTWSQVDVMNTEALVLVSHHDEESEFHSLYGFEVEELIERLSPEDRETFYSVLGKQPTGKPSGAKKASREQLFTRIREVRCELEAAKELTHFKAL